MARQAILYTPRGPTVFRNVRKDSGNVPLILMAEWETRKVALDLSSLLEASETISSATVTAEGITASVSTSGSVITLTLSGPSSWGEATITITLSSGEIIKQTIRAREQAATQDPTEVAYSL